ncbi:MAG TPA: ectoine synthase [Pseudogracilibacillus sp.]|nr:ectoine synthase [Pseudogracilibacillus sp.]
MIVRNIEDIIGTENETKAETWSSRRMLLRKDGMGFSFHETIIYAGTETHIHYQNHLEAVYCVAGDGEIETIKDGKVYPIKDGTLYALDKNDEHYLRGGKEDMRLICTFNPAVVGPETHDEDGVYPLLDDDGNRIK